MSLELQRAFGLRREEAIKLNPSYADRGDRLALKPQLSVRQGLPKDRPMPPLLDGVQAPYRSCIIRADLAEWA
jgi:hypothetical protein